MHLPLAIAQEQTTNDPPRQSPAHVAASLVRVVHVPHPHEARFNVRRLSICGALVDASDPEERCAEVQLALAKWIEGME